MELLVQLPRGLDEQLVDATLLSLTQKHVDDFVTRWQPALIQATQENEYWDWEFKERIAQKQDNQECYAVECNGDTQGLIMLETQKQRAERLLVLEILLTILIARRLNSSQAFLPLRLLQQPNNPLILPIEHPGLLLNYFCLPIQLPPRGTAVEHQQ